MELDAFRDVLPQSGQALAQLYQKGLFSDSKIWKKHKNVRTMSKKTERCRRKTIKNAQKHRKTIEFGGANVKFGQNGVFLAHFDPKRGNYGFDDRLRGYFYPLGASGDP